MNPTSQAKHRIRWIAARSAILGMLVSSFLAPAAVLSHYSAAANEQGVRQIGFIPYGFDSPAANAMAVDPILHRGFYTGVDDRMYVFDLAGMRRLGSFAIGQVGTTFAVDALHHRIFYRSSGPSVNCADSKLIVINSATFEITNPQVPCFGPSNASFFVRGVSYYAPTNKLYVIGSTAEEAFVVQGFGISPYRESTIIRQLDADTLELDWEIDASNRCDTNTNSVTAADPVVARTKGGVISYCYVGGQGRAIWIPMTDDEPVVDTNGDPVVRLSPTIGRTTTPIIDPGSGRLLILEDQPPFGPGVYVYDPERERFDGIVPSGVSLEHEGTRYDYWRGFSIDTGRLYIQNRTGLVIADVRANPLPAGVSYPVLTGKHGNVTTGPIAIDPSLGRLFYPYPNRGLVVLEDRVPFPAKHQAENPDAGTADVAEVPGVTGRTFSSAATAFGAHVINVGGISRLGNNSDPLCTSVSGINDRDEYGRCPLDQTLTPGNREFFMSLSSIESGSDSGVTASAALQRSPSNDTATDSDVRAISRCVADRLPGQVAPTILAACPNGTGEDGKEEGVLTPFGGGTQGRDGKGYPIPGALCTDFDGKAKKDPGPSEPFGSATSSCDYSNHRASSDARVSALRIGTSPDSPMLTIGETETSVTTVLTAKGVETTATSTLSGVVIGGQITIGKMQTSAITWAKGRTKSTRAKYDLDFADVRAPGFRCGTCDPKQVAEQINRVFGAQMRARVPSPFELASPRGYQGIVSKEPGLLVSDRAVNDDDSITVNGLDLIYYNDSSPANRNGSAGRSRVLVSLAGVQAESRYGIFVLPSSTDGEYQPGPDADAPPSEPQVSPTSVPGERPTPTPEPGAQNVGGGAVAIVTDAFTLVRTRPREAGMLFVLWSLFASPIYMSIRRRALASALNA